MAMAGSVVAGAGVQATRGPHSVREETERLLWLGRMPAKHKSNTLVLCAVACAAPDPHSPCRAARRVGRLTQSGGAPAPHLPCHRPSLCHLASLHALFECHVNRDPWSVLDLYLEEVEIEIIVEDRGKVTRDPDKATQCDAQLKELLSLFVKKQSESGQSNLSTSDTAPTVPTEVCSEAPSEKEHGNSPLQGESTRGRESEGNTIARDSHQDVNASEQQQTQNSAYAKTSETELVDADKIEEKDITTDTFHELPCGENISQFDVIDKSIASTNMGQEDSQPLDKVGSDRENLSTQEDVYSGENESVPTLQVDTNSLSSEKAVCVKGQLVSDIFEGVCTSSLEKDDGEKIISSGQETLVSVKQSSDKPQNVLGSELVKTGNSESIVESCVTENTQSLSSSFNQSCAGKSAFASTSRQCTDDFDSALNFLEMSKYESPWFEKVCDKRLQSESEKIRTEKLNLGGPVVNVGPDRDNTDTLNFDSSPSSSPETTSQYFLNPPKFGPVRNWIGCEDDTSLTGYDLCSQETLQETIPPSRCSGVKVKGSRSSGFKVKGSSSKYFQSLVKDLDFDDKFLQCPVNEPPSETFCEHLKSSDFFGETASDYPTHIEEPETAEYISDFIYKDYLGINGISKSCVQAWSQPLSGTETSANTQVPHVPSPSNIAQVPITSVTTNIASCKVSSVERKTSLGRKVVIIPKTSNVRYLLTQSSGSHSFLGGSLPRPELSSESLGLQSSVAGSSGEVNVGGKKADHLSEFIKYSERETDIAKRSIKERSGCAFEMTDTLDPVEVRNQEHLSNAEHVRGDLKSEQMSALSDSSQDFVRKESRVDVFLKNEPVCASVTANTTETPASNTASLQQTSSCHCSAKISDNSKNCECYSRNLKDKTEISTYCAEQTGSQLDSLSDSDEMMMMMIVKFHSYLLIQMITIPETEDLASQEKKGYCIASGKDMGDDVAVDKCIESEEIIKDSFSLKIKESETAVARTVTLGQKRKADALDESNKKRKLLDTSAEIEDEESIQKHDNRSQAFSNSQRGLLMCGILDASIVHDEHCCSSLHRDFQEFPARTENKENTHKTEKTYAVPSKQCSSSHHKCTDEGINDAPRFCDGGEGADNDYSVSSNAKATTTHTPHGRTGSNYDPKFGSVIASPQYDSSSCLSVEKEASDLDFFHTGFLAPLISPIDSPIVGVDPSQEEKNVVPCTLQDSRGGVDASVKENVAGEECQQNELNDEMAHNTSERSFITNTGDDLKEENISTPKLSNIPSTSDMSSTNTAQSTNSSQAKPLKAGLLDKMIFTKMGLSNGNKSQSTSGNFLEFCTLGKTIVLRKSSQPHPTVSSHYSVASNMTSRLTNSVSLPLVSSQASPKMNDGAEKQHIPGATGHHSLMILPSCHSSKNMPLQPWPMTSSSLAQSGTTVNQVMTSDSHKQTSLIDYQIPANPTTTTVPPALAANQSYSLPVLAQSSHSVSMSSKGSVGMSTLLGNTTDSGVVRAASTPLYLNPLKANQSILYEQVRKNLESFLGDVNVEEAGGNEEGSSMLKKVKLGSKGSFYLRPTPALKNAISEMRKKENTEDKEEEATSSCYLTFPDGKPIPHPMSLPATVRTVPTSEVKVIKHKRKKRRKRKIRKRDVKKMFKERVDKLLECSKSNEIPKVMVIYTMGSFHICEIDVTDGR
ncbi:hypothetical protein GWK47_036070 [Chionoecetes opilio]|uniref:Uncharacterized protein n=1 Tax=Chionoecetes opilio TaxID=41210 RepID=A0A8J5D207_CHIOP|nr:hypothetical protein GWK47_036070 [Chionoecetes opilio]